MTTVRIKWHGETYKRRISGLTDRGVRRLALGVEREAKTGMTKTPRHVPSRPGEPPGVQTGHLRRSITHEFAQDSAGFAARVGTNVFYGRIHEFGGTVHPARPWLRAALARAMGRFSQFFERDR